MEIKFHNTPEPKVFDASLLPSEAPTFLRHEPNWQAIEALVPTYQQYKNILVIGHGGSVTSFKALYYGLIEQSRKVAWFLSTVDPDYIGWLKIQLQPENTVVVAVSKSGETVTQLEALMQFLNYPLVFVTCKGSPLSEIAQKIGAAEIEHPNIGGRYTGFSEVGLVPAALCGFDCRALFSAGRAVHQKFQSENNAWKVASVLHLLEQKGYVDVFMPVYDYLLDMSAPLITQLCHESFGKDGKGQTFVAFQAPESQHHTNQRFFGGPKNMLGFFIGVEAPRHRLETHVPESLADIQLKSETLSLINGIPLDRAMDFEREATMEDAIIHNIPVVSLVLNQRNNESIAQFIAFWQLFAVYASLLRGVNPFDQPQVEASKKLSFEKRLKYRQ
jgi:glucose-6-phosphate isomerase